MRVTTVAFVMDFAFGKSTVKVETNQICHGLLLTLCNHQANCGFLHVTPQARIVDVTATKSFSTKQRPEGR